MEQAKNKDAFSFVFEGNNEIDAELLGTALVNLSFIVNTMIKSESEKSVCKLQVQTMENGIFAVVFNLVSELIRMLPTMSTIRDVESIVSGLVGIFQIKAFLKGKRPKSIKESAREGVVYIKDLYGTEITAPLGSKIVIKNLQVDKKASEVAEMVYQHNPQGGFRLEREAFCHRFDSEEVKHIKEPVSISEVADDSLMSTTRTILPVKSVTFYGDRMWQFIFDGRTIGAHILDAEFLEAVRNGNHAYKAGDCLDVDLCIIVSRGSGEQKSHTQYLVQKVYGLIPRNEQMRF